jgi:hypothetical protein
LVSPSISMSGALLSDATFVPHAVRRTTRWAEIAQRGRIASAQGPIDASR